MQKEIKAWGHCYDCHFEGLLNYNFLEGEVYDDSEDSGVMLLQHCPACDTSENTLIPTELFHEMVQDVADTVEANCANSVD